MNAPQNQQNGKRRRAAAKEAGAWETDGHGGGRHVSLHFFSNLLTSVNTYDKIYLYQTR